MSGTTPRIDDPGVPVVVVFGTRTFTDYGLLVEKLNAFTAALGPDIVVATGEWRGVGYGTPNYRGADLLAEQWAYQIRRCPVRRFPPDFALGSPACFHARNREMIEWAAGVRDGFAVGFWDGKSPGTKSVIGLCRKLKVPLKVVRYNGA